MALPIPLEPPVMRTTFPVRGRGVVVMDMVVEIGVGSGIAR